MKLTSRRYIGNKRKLLTWIFDKLTLYTEGESFLDIFAGTGAVAERAIEIYPKVIINDFLLSNYLIYQAFWSQETYDITKIEQYVNLFNNLDIVEDNYFSNNYANKYFGINDARKIGYIRDLLQQDAEKNLLNLRELNILLASLIYSIDKIANTVGHYEAYRKVQLKDNIFKFKLLHITNNNTKIELYCEDANLLARQLKADIVFLDPPYNSRQYSRFYHLIENLVEWKKPQLYGVAAKPKAQNMSEYCRKNAALVFKDLVDNLKCKYIVVTYNNTYHSKSSSSQNKISLNQILEILNQRGETKVFTHDYQYFNSGKTNFDNHQEYLFITKVQDEK